MATQATGMKSSWADMSGANDVPNPLELLKQATSYFEVGLNEAGIAQQALSDLMHKAVKERSRIEQLQIDMESIEMRVVRDAALPERSNEKGREAIYRDELEGDEEYSSYQEELLELSETYGETKAEMEAQGDLLGIAKRKMDFASSLLTCIGGLAVHTSQATKA